MSFPLSWCQRCEVYYAREPTDPPGDAACPNAGTHA